MNLPRLAVCTLNNTPLVAHYRAVAPVKEAAGFWLGKNNPKIQCHPFWGIHLKYILVSCDLRTWRLHLGHFMSAMALSQQA